MPSNATLRFGRGIAFPGVVAAAAGYAIAARTMPWVIGHRVVYVTGTPAIALASAALAFALLCHLREYKDWYAGSPRTMTIVDVALILAVLAGFATGLVESTLARTSHAGALS